MAAAMASLGSAAEIGLAVGNFDPLERTVVVAPDLRASSEDRGLWLVQWQQTPGATELAEARATGATLLDYFAENAYLVRGERSRLQGMSGVRWIGAFHPGFKLDPALGTAKISDPERVQERENGLLRTVVTLTRDADSFLAQVLIQGTGASVLSSGNIADQPVLTVLGTREMIENVARLAEVQFIEDSLQPTFRNNTSRWITQTNTTNFTPLYTAGVTGAGFIVGVIDGALWTGHSSFSDTVPVGSTHRKVVYYGGTVGADSHGTHTSGTIAGDAGTFDDRRGIAFGARIAFTNGPTSSTETALYNIFTTHHNQGARDHSNSWGSDSASTYNAWSRAVDRFSYDFEDSMVAFSITNFVGQLNIPENAKNVLAVAATRDTPDQNLNPSGFSGTGPAVGGRRKPEISAPGEGILSSSSLSANGVVSQSGTSMACPAATGAATLIRDFLADGRIYNGNANAAYAVNASGALLRAMIVTSGVDMATEAIYPGNREGFGRVLLTNVLALPGASRRTVLWDVRRAQGLAAGGSRTFQFRVTNTNQPLRVTMAFTDAPAAAGASVIPINNVNLRVTTPAGTTFWGNSFNSSGTSITPGSADNINSVEMVNIPSPAVGTYTVQIDAPTVAVGGTQGFAVVANGAVARGQVDFSLNFANFSGTRPANLNVSFLTATNAAINGGDVTATGTNGNYSVEPPPTVNGNYRVAVKPTGFLRRIIPSGSATSLITSLGTFTLTNGDVNNDNVIDGNDVNAVLALFGTEGSGIASDVNGDTVVDGNDINIILSNFGAEGE